jgi:hypothetical protein
LVAKEEGDLRLSEELVARVLEAREQARSLSFDAARVTQLSRLLRDARADGTLLLRCAWCGKLQVGAEWLRLDATGSGQTRIAEQLVRVSSHGICPGCYDRVRSEADAERPA